LCFLWTLVETDCAALPEASTCVMRQDGPAACVPGRAQQADAGVADSGAAEDDDTVKVDCSCRVGPAPKAAPPPGLFLLLLLAALRLRRRVS
jgi:MYXO-CTERM domain-containing protein